MTLAARQRGAVIRPLGDVVVLMPPLAISEDDLRRLVAITAVVDRREVSRGAAAVDAAALTGARRLAAIRRRA